MRGVRTRHIRFLTDADRHTGRHDYHETHRRIRPVRVDEYALVCQVLRAEESVDGALCPEYGGYGHEPWDKGGDRAGMMPCGMLRQCHRKPADAMLIHGGKRSRWHRLGDMRLSGGRRFRWKSLGESTSRD